MTIPIVKLNQRVIAALVLVCFTVSNHLNLGYAAAAIPSSAAIEFKVFPHDISSLRLPAQMGRVEESFKGNDGEAVVIIQDAHSIPDAQKNIQKIIGYFQKQYGVKLVGLEGASSRLDPQIFKSFPDRKLLRQIFSQYLNQGELTAGTGAAIFSEGAAAETVFQGVEDWDLYEQGLGLYLAAIKREPELRKKVDAWKESLQAQKDQIYSAELISLDKKLESFQRNDSDLVETFKALAAVQAPAKGTDLSAFWEEMQSEKTGDAGIELEVNRIARLVAKHLNAKSPTPQTNKDLLVFHDKLQDFKISRLSPQAFALFLKELIAKDNLGVTVSPRLLGGIENQKKMRDLEGTKFFRDLEAYAKKVKLSLMHSQDQRLLDSQTESLRMAEKMMKLELSREEWGRYKKNKILMSENFVREEDLSLHEAFYENAEARDAAFLKNLGKGQENGKETHQKSALLIAGGFHAQGLTQRLKEKNISYLLVMPEIQNIPKETHYQEQMKDEVSWKKYFELENGKIDLYKAFVRGTRDKLLEADESKILLKNWRDQIIRDLSEKKKIQQAGEYTKFLDEILEKGPNSADSRLKISFEKINQFILGLRGLKENNDLTENNIMNLLKPSAVSPRAPGAAIAKGSFATVQSALVSSAAGPENISRRRGKTLISRVPTIQARAESRSPLKDSQFPLRAEARPNLMDINRHAKSLGYADVKEMVSQTLQSGTEINRGRNSKVFYIADKSGKNRSGLIALRVLVDTTPAATLTSDFEEVLHELDFNVGQILAKAQSTEGEIEIVWYQSGEDVGVSRSYMRAADREAARRQATVDYAAYLKKAADMDARAYQKLADQAKTILTNSPYRIDSSKANNLRMDTQKQEFGFVDLNKVGNKMPPNPSMDILRMLLDMNFYSKEAQTEENLNNMRSIALKWIQASLAAELPVTRDLEFLNVVESLFGMLEITLEGAESVQARLAKIEKLALAQQPGALIAFYQEVVSALSKESGDSLETAVKKLISGKLSENDLLDMQDVLVEAGGKTLDQIEAMGSEVSAALKGPQGKEVEQALTDVLFNIARADNAAELERASRIAFRLALRSGQASGLQTKLEAALQVRSRNIDEIRIEAAFEALFDKTMTAEAGGRVEEALLKEGDKTLAFTEAHPERIGSLWEKTKYPYGVSRTIGVLLSIAEQNQGDKGIEQRVIKALEVLEIELGEAGELVNLRLESFLQETEEKQGSAAQTAAAEFLTKLKANHSMRVDAEGVALQDRTLNRIKTDFFAAVNAGDANLLESTTGIDSSSLKEGDVLLNPSTGTFIAINQITKGNILAYHNLNDTNKVQFGKIPSEVIKDSFVKIIRQPTRAENRHPDKKTEGEGTLRTAESDLLLIETLVAEFFEENGRLFSSQRDYEAEDKQLLREVLSVLVEIIKWPDVGNTKIVAKNIMNSILFSFGDANSFRQFLVELKYFFTQIDLRFNEAGKTESADAKSEILKKVSREIDFVSAENRRGESLYQANPFLGIDAFRGFFDKIFVSWDQTQGSNPQRFSENGRVLLHLAMVMSQREGFNKETLDKKGWGHLEQFLRQEKIKFEGKVYRRGEAAISTSAADAEFSEGKNPIFQVTLLNEAGASERKILVKADVAQRGFDKIVTELSPKMGVTSYRVDDFEGRGVEEVRGAKPPPLQLIEFVPSKIVYFQSQARELDGASTAHSRIEVLNALPRDQKLKALAELGGHLALDYLLGGRDTMMKHFLLTEDGHFIKIDHEYLFQYEASSKQRFLPGALDRESDFWGFLEEVKKNQPLQGWDETKAIRDGFDRVLRAVSYNENGLLDEMMRVIQSKKLTVTKNPAQVEKIKKQIERRSSHSFEMLRAIAERSEARDGQKPFNTNVSSAEAILNKVTHEGQRLAIAVYELGRDLDGNLKLGGYSREAEEAHKKAVKNRIEKEYTGILDEGTLTQVLSLVESMSVYAAQSRVTGKAVTVIIPGDNLGYLFKNNAGAFSAFGTVIINPEEMKKYGTDALRSTEEHEAAHKDFDVDAVYKDEKQRKYVSEIYAQLSGELYKLERLQPQAPEDMKSKLMNKIDKELTRWEYAESYGQLTEAELEDLTFALSAAVEILIRLRDQEPSKEALESIRQLLLMGIDLQDLRTRLQEKVEAMGLVENVNQWVSSLPASQHRQDNARKKGERLANKIINMIEIAPVDLQWAMIRNLEERIREAQQRHVKAVDMRNVITQSVSLPSDENAFSGASYDPVKGEFKIPVKLFESIAPVYAGQETEFKQLLPADFEIGAALKGRGLEEMRSALDRLSRIQLIDPTMLQRLDSPKSLWGQLLDKSLSFVMSIFGRRAEPRNQQTLSSRNGKMPEEGANTEPRSEARPDLPSWYTNVIRSRGQDWKSIASDILKEQSKTEIRGTMLPSEEKRRTWSVYLYQGRIYAPDGPLTIEFEGLPENAEINPDKQPLPGQIYKSHESSAVLTAWRIIDFRKNPPSKIFVYPENVEEVKRALEALDLPGIEVSSTAGLKADPNKYYHSVRADSGNADRWKGLLKEGAIMAPLERDYRYDLLVTKLGNIQTLNREAFLEQFLILDRQMLEADQSYRAENRGEGVESERRPGETPDFYRYDLGLTMSGWDASSQNEDSRLRSVALRELTGEKFNVSAKEIKDARGEFYSVYEIKIEEDGRRIYEKQGSARDFTNAGIFKFLEELNDLLSPHRRALANQDRLEKTLEKGLRRLILVMAAFTGFGFALIILGPNIMQAFRPAAVAILTAFAETLGFLAIALAGVSMFNRVTDIFFFRAQKAERIIRNFQNAASRNDQSGGAAQTVRSENRGELPPMMSFRQHYITRRIYTFYDLRELAKVYRPGIENSDLQIEMGQLNITPDLISPDIQGGENQLSNLRDEIAQAHGFVEIMKILQRKHGFSEGDPVWTALNHYFYIERTEPDISLIPDTPEEQAAADRQSEIEAAIKRSIETVLEDANALEDARRVLSMIAEEESSLGLVDERIISGPTAVPLEPGHWPHVIRRAEEVLLSRNEARDGVAATEMNKDNREKKRERIDELRGRAGEKLAQAGIIGSSVPQLSDVLARLAVKIEEEGGVRSDDKRYPEGYYRQNYSADVLLSFLSTKIADGVSRGNLKLTYSLLEHLTVVVERQPSYIATAVLSWGMLHLQNLMSQLGEEQTFAVLEMLKSDRLEYGDFEILASLAPLEKHFGVTSIVNALKEFTGGAPVPVSVFQILLQLEKNGMIVGDEELGDAIQLVLKVAALGAKRFYPKWGSEVLSYWVQAFGFKTVSDAVDVYEAKLPDLDRFELKGWKTRSFDEILSDLREAKFNNKKGFVAEVDSLSDPEMPDRVLNIKDTLVAKRGLEGEDSSPEEIAGQLLSVYPWIENLRAFDREIFKTLLEFLDRELHAAASPNALSAREKVNTLGQAALILERYQQELELGKVSLERVFLRDAPNPYGRSRSEFLANQVLTNIKQEMPFLSKFNPNKTVYEQMKDPSLLANSLNQLVFSAFEMIEQEVFRKHSNAERDRAARNLKTETGIDEADIRLLTALSAADRNAKKTLMDELNRASGKLEDESATNELLATVISKVFEDKKLREKFLLQSGEKSFSGVLPLSKSLKTRGVPGEVAVLKAKVSPKLKAQYLNLLMREGVENLLLSSELADALGEKGIAYLHFQGTAIVAVGQERKYFGDSEYTVRLRRDGAGIIHVSKAVGEAELYDRASFLAAVKAYNNSMRSEARDGVDTKSFELLEANKDDREKMKEAWEILAQEVFSKASRFSDAQLKQLFDLIYENRIFSNLYAPSASIQADFSGSMVKIRSVLQVGRTAEEFSRVLSEWAQEKLGAVNASGNFLILAHQSLPQQEFLEKYPAMAPFLFDQSKAKVFYELLAVFRMLTDWRNMEVDKATGRVQRIQGNQQPIEIGKNVFVRSDTGSFRRHVIYETDDAGNVRGAFELKIPGDWAGKTEVAEEDYTVGQDLVNLNPALKGKVQQGVFVLKFPGEIPFQLYGLKKFETDLQVVISESQFPAEYSRLEDYLALNLPGKEKRALLAAGKSIQVPIPADKVASLADQIVAILKGVFEAGYVGDLDLIHLQNFTVVKKSDAEFEVSLPNDFTDFKKMSDFNEDLFEGGTDEGLGDAQILASIQRSALSIKGYLLQAFPDQRDLINSKFKVVDPKDDSFFLPDLIRAESRIDDDSTQRVQPAQQILKPLLAERRLPQEILNRTGTPAPRKAQTVEQDSVVLKLGPSIRFKNFMVENGLLPADGEGVQGWLKVDFSRMPEKAGVKYEALNAGRNKLITDLNAAGDHSLDYVITPFVNGFTSIASDETLLDLILRKLKLTENARLIVYDESDVRTIDGGLEKLDEKFNVAYQYDNGDPLPQFSDAGYLVLFPKRSEFRSEFIAMIPGVGEKIAGGEPITRPEAQAVKAVYVEAGEGELQQALRRGVESYYANLSQGSSDLSQYKYDAMKQEELKLVEAMRTIPGMSRQKVTIGLGGEKMPAPMESIFLSVIEAAGDVGAVVPAGMTVTTTLSRGLRDRDVMLRPTSSVAKAVIVDGQTEIPLYLLDESVKVKVNGSYIPITVKLKGSLSNDDRVLAEAHAQRLAMMTLILSARFLSDPAVKTKADLLKKLNEITAFRNLFSTDNDSLVIDGDAAWSAILQSALQAKQAAARAA